MKVENMKNYDYEDWLNSNYLSSDYTDEEIKELYEMCNKNKSFEIDMFSTNTWDKPYIAHYITKSKEEFIERRSRVRADTNSARSDLEGFWNEHNVNEVDNFDVVKFAGDF